MIFAEWKMTGYFLEVYHGSSKQRRFLSQQGSAEQRRNSGDFVWSVFEATRGLIGGISSPCFRPCFLSSCLSLFGSHALSHTISLPVLAFALFASFLLLFPLNVLKAGILTNIGEMWHLSTLIWFIKIGCHLDINLSCVAMLPVILLCNKKKFCNSGGH